MPEIKSITAGNSASWEKELKDYLPSDGWDLKYSLVNQNRQFTINSTNSDDVFQISIPSDKKNNELKITLAD